MSPISASTPLAKTPGHLRSIDNDFAIDPTRKPFSKLGRYLVAKINLISDTELKIHLALWSGELLAKLDARYAN
jgi:hypothetical protein